MATDVKLSAKETHLPQLAEQDLRRFSDGHHWAVWRMLGANPFRLGETDGLLFAVWAPAAVAVSLVGDFNQWHGQCHLMQKIEPHGVWECFVAGLSAGARYKFEILTADGQRLLKSDPFARAYDLRPGTAALAVTGDEYAWGDAEWQRGHTKHEWLRSPMSIYEVHLGSWRRRDGGFMSYREVAQPLADHVQQLGFTHVEFLPLTEHPFDGSWGYQPLGMYAPTSRFGSGDDLKFLIDTLHQRGIGALLDWVPAHFPRDDHGLARFDGTALYEHANPQRGEHAEWGTLVYDFAHCQSKNF